MSHIIVPAKPSWRITINLDDRGQAQVLVEDIQSENKPVRIPSVVRQMNPLQFATILLDIAASTLKQMQAAAVKGSRKNESKETAQ